MEKEHVRECAATFLGDQSSCISIDSISIILHSM